MCTVTYLPLGNNNFILTSNRDEDPKRNTIAPKSYLENNVTVIFPKDEVAGGTWIGLSEKKRLICLLNGGFENHKRAASYKMSRGVIVKMLLAVNDAITEIKNFNFNEIEPFTIVLVDWKSQLQAYELVWTGTEKSFKKLEEKPHIWSSSTLYTNEMKLNRKKWFSDWITKNNSEFNAEKIVLFHQDTSKGTKETAIKMKRETVETISTTCVEKSKNEFAITYNDYVNNTTASLKTLI